MNMYVNRSELEGLRPVTMLPKSRSSIKFPNSLPKEQLLTIIMLDIVDSTRLSATLSSQDIGQLLLRYYSLCGAEISSNNGRIVRCIGDGVLGVFEDEDGKLSSATAATHAAINIRSGIKKTSSDSLPDQKTIEIRICIVTGLGIPVFVDQLNQEMVFGQLPFIADRLKSSAKKNEIILNNLAAEIVGSSFDLISCPNVVMRGFSCRTDAWRLT